MVSKSTLRTVGASFFLAILPPPGWYRSTNPKPGQTWKVFMPEKSELPHATESRITCFFSNGFQVVNHERREIRFSFANGKNKLLQSVSSCFFNGVKIFVFVMNSRRRFFFFLSDIFRSWKKNTKSEKISVVCHLPWSSCLAGLLKIP